VVTARAVRCVVCSVIIVFVFVLMMVDGSGKDWWSGARLRALLLRSQSAERGVVSQPYSYQRRVPILWYMWGVVRLLRLGYIAGNSMRLLTGDRGLSEQKVRLPGPLPG